MKDNKLDTITNLFEGSEIRSVWNYEKEEYYFSVVDIIKALTDSPNPRNYWNMLKKRMEDEEGSQLYTNCVQFKILAKDGKRRLTDMLDIEGIFRLIESVPSPKAEPFKLWLANLGKQEVDNIFDPSIGINKMIDYYLNKGYSLDWIEVRIKAILNRKKLTNIWKEHGIVDEKEFAFLTNQIYKMWTDMTAAEYKKYKGLTKENLRDHMSDIEVVLNDLGEIATWDITSKENPWGLKENAKVAKRGGMVSKVAKDYYENETGNKVVTKQNKKGVTLIEDDSKA